MRRTRSVLGLFFWTVCGTVVAGALTLWVWGVVAGFLAAPH